MLFSVMRADRILRRKKKTTQTKHERNPDLFRASLSLQSSFKVFGQIINILDANGKSDQVFRWRELTSQSGRDAGV